MTLNIGATTSCWRLERHRFIGSQNSLDIHWQSLQKDLLHDAAYQVFVPEKLMHSSQKLRGFSIAKRFRDQELSEAFLFGGGGTLYQTRL